MYNVYILVSVADELGQSWETLLDYFERRRRVLVTTEIGNCPRHVPQERSRSVWTD